MDSLARGVEKRFSAFATRTTKRTTVRDAKLAEKFLRIAVCQGYWDRTGRVRSKNSRLSSAASTADVARSICHPPGRNRSLLIDRRVRLREIDALCNAPLACGMPGRFVYWRPGQLAVPAVG